MTPSRTSGHLAVAAGFDPREVSAATRERRARACSSPSSMSSTAFAILAMARVVDAAVVPEWPGDLTSKPEPWSDPAGVSAQHAGIVEPFLVENVYDNDIAGGKSFLQNRDSWSMYYSGVAKGPWVQLDLGAEKTISAIEIYGHRAEPRCDLNLLESFSKGCDGSVEQLGDDYYPTFSMEVYAKTNDGGAVIGVGPPGETGPCVDGPGGSGGNCAGVVCATLSTMTDVGFANLGEDGIEKLPDASIKVICEAKPVGQYVYVYLPGPNRELFLGEIRVAYADAGTPAGITCPASDDGAPLNVLKTDSAETCVKALVAGEKCTPECEAGYTPVNAECSVEGDLTPARCDPKPCDMAFPQNGGKGDCPNANQQMESGSTCTPACDSGYEVEGKTSCLAGKLTSATCGEIKCDAPLEAPANTVVEGEVVQQCLEPLAAGEKCTPECEAGYTPVNAECSVEGDLTPARCDPKPCDMAFPQNGGKGDCPNTNQQMESGSTCTPACDSGYEVEGKTSCLAGKLTSATCGEIKCDAPLEAPANTVVEGEVVQQCLEPLAAGEKCTPECEAGYTPVNAECSVEGDLTPARCDPKPCDMAFPQNGGKGDCPNTNQQMESGSTCTPACDSGYEVEGKTSCLAGKLTSATCGEIKCDAPLEAPANTVVEGEVVQQCLEPLAAGEKCTPECEAGYTPVNAECSVEGDLTPARCDPKPCDMAFPQNGGKGDCPNANQQMESGSTCTPACDSGYEVEGKTSCLAGKLTSATCGQIKCDAPVEAPANTVIEGEVVQQCLEPLAAGEKCTPECEAGYTPVNAECSVEGDLTPARCDPKPCIIAKAPTNGKSGTCENELASGSTCIPKCNNGFTLSGETSCSLGVLQESTCDPAPCDASKAPENGKVGDCTSELAVGTTCQPECDEGYSVDGVTSCVDGELKAASCLKLGGNACDASALPENAARAGDCTDSLAGGSTCSPVCKTGYTATPASCSDGTLTRATCVGTACDASQAPANGNIGSGATQCTNPMASGTQCQPGCDEGYDASGPTSCLNGVLTAATCVTRACPDGETVYDGDCHPDVPVAQNTAFLDEYMELGSVTGRSTLSDAELTEIADTLKKFAADGKNEGQYTVSFLYAPKTGGTAPDIPGTSVWTSGSLAIVARIELPSNKLSAASQALGSAFFSGDLLSELRAELGDDFSECTLLSKAFRQSKANKIDLFPARVSNQLVADEDNKCLDNNGGCHPDVTCTPDPSRDPPVVCGACPAGFDGDGTVAGTGCQDVDECTDTALVNGGCSPLVTCTNTIGGRACGACPAGYTGDGTTCDDVDECAKNNGGCDRRTTCTNIDGGRECGACPSGYKGSGETKCVRESGCSVKNGGCDKLVTCTDDGNGGSICGACPEGYDGDGTSGCVDHDACVNNPCAAGVHCKDDKPPLMTRSCGKCPAGQVGDGETCVGNPCFVKNGGCDPLRTCTVDESSGAAVCGDCPSGYELSGVTCVNTDGCANNPCYAGVLCTDLAPPRDGYKCGKCPPGYTGDGETCVDEDECERNNGGCDRLTTCTNNVGGPPTCGACPTGYKGSGTTGCKQAESACSKNNGGCDPAASCQEGANGIVCGPCPPTGYEPGGTGDTGCVDIDGCANNPCYAGVTCEDVPAPGVGHTCGACPEGFRGDGTTCALCDMSVWIAASTMVNGAMARGKDTRIVAAAQLMDAACTNEEGYQFQWSATRSDGEEVVLDPKRTKSDTMQLFLPKKSLPPGVSYTLRFEGRQASNPKVSSSAEFDFFVEAAPLEAIIVGGDVLLSEGVSFTLDATSSIDPDDDDEYEWEYTWQCEAVAPTAGDCLDWNGESIDLPRSSADKLENLELAGAAGPAGQTYTFTLAASRGPRRAETTTEVAVISAAAGATGAPPVASIAPFPGGKVNSGEYARIKSTVVSEASADSLAMLWSATRVPDGGGSTETVDLLSGNFISSSSITGAFLVLSPNVLETGYQYKFKLAVEDSNGEAAAFITLAENTPPSGGSVIAVPATGTALSTKFRLAASAWSDTDAPLAYRFTAQIKGEENVRQLQDFGPRSEYEGTLPGGLASESNVVIVGVQVRDSLGAVSAIAETEVTSAWPVLATEAAATEATTAAVAAAEEAFKSGGAEAAINQISAACLQLENFKQQQSRRRLLAANGCIGGGGVNATGAAAARAAEREKMLNVTRNAGEVIPASATLFAAMAGTAAQILADPCESTSAARASGVSVIANLVNVTSSADNDLTLDADGSLNMLSALSAAVTPVEANDTNAASAAEVATRAAMRVMKTQLSPAVPGEKPAAVNTTMMSYVAERMATRGNATAASTSSAAGASFSVPGEALALSGTDPVDQLLLAMAYDAHAASAPINATAAAEGDVSAAPRAAGTVSLTLSNSISGDELAVRNLAVPIAFELELNDGGADIGEDTCFAIDFARQLAAQSATPETEAENATDATLPPPKERAVCSFWDEDLLKYSSEGCATLPNPKFPGGTLAWAPGVQNGTVPLRAEDEVFLWVFAHPTALEGCEMEEVLASDNATRMRVYNQLNGSATNCTIEDPENEQRCHWRRDAQAFEGCGCETTPRVSCLCNHATDFTASASPPKVKTISIEELLSVSLDDLLNTWKVFAVVGGMFGCMMILAVTFEIRDRRARRKLLNKFIDGPSSEAMAFSVVSDVWTWSIDVQEMQFMFNNLHHPNTAEAVAEVLKERFGDDDARVERELKAIIDSKEDYCAMDVDRAVERRRKALLRAARAREGLPQVPGMREDERDDEDVDVGVVQQIEREIEKNVETADVGIRVTKENGKTRFESTLSSGNVLSHENKLAMGLEDGEEEEDFEADEKKAALARLGSKARRKRLRKLTHRSTKYVRPPREVDVSSLPVVKRNGPKFCANVGLKYVRFLIAFPIESLNRNLIMWKNANDKRGVFLPFDRAVGTAMVYAHLDMKNIVGHVEMASRIYDAAQLPWLMPTGVTFPLLVAEFKAMLSGNITGSGWMKRSTLWNIVSLQNPDGHWNASDSLAGALRAAGPPELSPPIDKVNANPIIKSFYGAEEMLRECPPRLRACARRMGHNTIDSIWCSLLAMEGCKQAGLNWVLNPWDDLFFEFDIVQCGWTWIELRVNCDAEIAAAVMEAETHAEVCVTRWREHFTDTVRGLHAMRMQEEKERLKKQAAKAGGVPAKITKFVCGALLSPVKAIKSFFAWLYGFVMWAIKLYMAAHMFFRVFLANPTDAFSAAERTVMQCTMYLTSLLLTVWFYYNKATECCVIFRQDIGCSSDPLDECQYVPAGAGCAVLMGQADLKPPGWTCTAFPDKKNGWHFLTVVSIQIVIMFPVKFILTKTFTEGGGSLTEPHWRQAVVAAGMNLMEVYVAWLECLFQAIEDPIGVFRKPEIAAIIARFAAAAKKTIMVTLMQQAMTFVAAFMWGLDKLGIYKKKKARERRFQDTDVIRGNIRSIAMSDATFALELADVPEDSGDAGARKGASVESRRLFTKGTVTGTVAAIGVHGVDDPTAKHPESSASSAAAVAADAEVGVVVGVPADLLPELHHMASLHAVYGGVRRRVKGTVGRDSPTSIHDAGAGAGSGASSESGLSDDDAADDLDARARDAAATAASLASRVAECAKAYATIGDAVDAATSLCDVMDAVVSEAENAEDGARAFALVRSAAHEAGAVAAATAMMRLPFDSPRAGDVALRVEMRSQCAGAAMLARVCLDNPEALLEFRIEDGFAVVEAMLARVDPAPTARAEADAAAVVAAAVNDSGRAARRAIAAGLVPRVRKRFHAASLVCYESSSALARLQGDRDERDRVVALAAAFAAMKSREREHERDPNATWFDVAEFYVDVARVMPPNVDCQSKHVGPAAAALAAMLRAFPGTADDAEEAMRRAAVIPALTGMTLGTSGYKAHATLAEAFGADAMHRMGKDTSGGDPAGTVLPPLAASASAAAGGDAAEKEGSKTLGSKDGGWAAKMMSRAGAALDAADDAAESVETRALKASKTVKEMVAMQTISLEELKVKRKQYLKKLKWSTLFMANVGWFLSMFVWFFGGYVIITYGVLIYRYLGPGEESTYITTWGMAFLINNFGLESMKIIGRKAFFILIITNVKKTFMKAAEALGWYEVYTEMVGMHLLAETGAYDSSSYRADEDDDGGDDDDDGGDGGGDGD